MSVTKMNLTNIERARKLLGNLVSNVDLLIPYLRMSVFSRKLPVDLGIPWWSFRAIERANQLLIGKDVFEYGTGGSTLHFARIARRIVCVEDDARWKSLVEERLDSNKISNVEVRLHPFDFKNPVDFESSNYVAAVDEGNWDVVIIDGQDWTFKERLTCFRRVEPRMKAGSVIILDDFWRYEELIGANSSKSVDVYESVGPARIGVTSTAFFYY